MRLQIEKFISTQSELQRLLASGAPVRVQTLNLDHLRLLSENPEFSYATDSATFFTADGWPVVALVRRFGVSVSRVTGSQAVADICTSTDLAGTSWALYGGSEEVGIKFGHALAEVDQHLVFHEHGDKKDWSADVEARRCADARVDGVMVAVSQPFGEIFASQLSKSGSCNFMIIGVGGGVEMQVGVQRRASAWSRRLGMEWLVRLKSDPRRLFSRYVVKDLPFFCLQVLPLLIRGNR